MKSLQLASVALAISLAAFAVGAQTPGAPASPEVTSGNQDAQQSPSAGRQLPEISATPGVTDPQQNATPGPQQRTTPSLPGTANENKADPTDQNNPK